MLPSELYLSPFADQGSDSLTGQQSVLIKAEPFCSRPPLASTIPQRSEMFLCKFFRVNSQAILNPFVR